MSNSLSHILPYPIKNARFTLGLAFRLASGVPTDPATPDTEFSTDGGATYTDCAEEITTGGANGTGYLTLTGAETNNNLVEIAAKSANCLTTPAILYPRVLAVVGTGTLSAGSAGGGTLGTLLAYDVTGCYIQTTGGTGGGGTGGANNQARKIVTYNVSTGAFTVTPNWETTPDATTTYSVLLPEGVTLGMLKTLNPATAGQTLVVGSTGIASANLTQILGTAITETAGLIAAAFTKFFNKATPTGTVNSLPDAVAGASGGVAIVGSNVGSATSVSGAVGSVSGNVGGNVVGSVGSVAGAVGSVTGMTASDVGAIKAKTDNLPAAPASTTNITGGTITTVTTATNLTTNNDKSGYALSPGGVQAIWDALTSAMTTAGSIGKRIVDFVTSLVYAAPPAAAPTASQNASTLLGTALTQHNVSALATSTVEDALSAARSQGAGAWSIDTAAKTITLKNPDGTTFRVFSIDSAVDPVLSRT